MTIFTDLVKGALGADSATAESQTQNLLQGALDLLDKAGGIEGIADKFQKSGLGDIVASWIGTGENQPISGEQLTKVLGRDKLEALAQQAGVPASAGANVLASLFPTLLDKLTPGGEAPDRNQLAYVGKVILGGLGVAAAAKAAASVFGKKDEDAAPASGAPAAADAASSGQSGQAGTSGTRVVASGDTLSKIAQDVYGDGTLWKRIFDANRDILSDPNRIWPGQVLRIP